MLPQILQAAQDDFLPIQLGNTENNRLDFLLTFFFLLHASKQSSRFTIL